MVGSGGGGADVGEGWWKSRLAYANGIGQRGAMMTHHRKVKLFKNGRSQAVRIPREFELPGTEAIMRKEGERLIIEPAQPTSLLALLAALSPIAEDFGDIADPLPGAVEI